ncbi:MAG: metallophosphoesterase [Gammaproteobacteria bacterium]|nr:metallophosphoesterase [Gammaproteobacteria bacterium]
MDTKILRNLLGGLVGFAFLGAVGAANAATVTDTSGFNTPISVINFSQYAFCTDYGSAPCQNQDVGGLVGESVLFTGTNGFLGASLYNAEFGLGSNGSWDSGRNGYVGINNQQGGSGIFAEFEFAQGLSDVGAFVNYGPGIGGTPLMQVFDINHVLLETFSVSVAAPIATTGTNNGAFRGFSRASDDIYFIRFTDGFTVLDDLSFARSGAQPTVFSIIVVPDTQIYVEQNPEIFEAQVQWIVDNQVAENIIYVAHLGDLKDDLSCDNKTVTNGTGGGRTEWAIVDDTFVVLENANIPYGVVPGNHDFDQLNGGCPNFSTQRPLSDYNQFFGPTRFNGQPYYGDPSVPTPGNRVTNSNEDNFTLFGFGGVEFIAINLAYKQAANSSGNDQEVTWADALLKAYPNRLGIITTHYFLNQNPEVGVGGSRNNFGPYGQEVYDGLSNNPNLFMMLSAHQRGEAWRVETTGRGGLNPVQVLLSDYQSVNYPSNPNNVDYGNLNGNRGNFGDAGFIRIMRFDMVTGMVNIETFIPPVPFLGRNNALVSDYFPGSGTGMDKDTASNLSFPFP